MGCMALQSAAVVVVFFFFFIEMAVKVSDFKPIMCQVCWLSAAMVCLHAVCLHWLFDFEDTHYFCMSVLASNSNCHVFLFFIDIFDFLSS